MKSTIILPEWLITDARVKPFNQWGVRIRGSEIIEIAPNLELRKRYPEDDVWDAPNQTLSPGFVNSHTHMYGILSHGIPMTKAPQGFWPFLTEFWWPLIEDRLDHEMICAATDLRCAQMLKSGVTTFYDCIEAPNALPGCLEKQAAVVKRHGLRAILSFEATERVSQENGQLGLDENARFVDLCRRDGGLITGLICHHTLCTCSKEFIQKASALARDLGVLHHAHVSEGTYEPQYAVENFKMRPLQYYHELGVTGPNFLASQCIQIDSSEISVLSESDMCVTHMPLSNCMVGGGIAPIPQMIEAGVTVGLGSDGYIDDFFEVMRCAFLIHKANQLDPGLMPANMVWYMATEGGARALKLDKVGRVELGWQADLQLIENSLPTPVEEHNLYEQLLVNRNASHVQTVWVAGQKRVQHGIVLNVVMDELENNSYLAAERLWSFAK